MVLDLRGGSLCKSILEGGEVSSNVPTNYHWSSFEQAVIIFCGRDWISHIRNFFWKLEVRENKAKAPLKPAGKGNRNGGPFEENTVLI